MIRRSAAPRRGVPSPPEQELLGAMTSHGPFPRVLQAIPKIKRAAGGNGRHAGSGVRPGRGGACSKDVSGGFVRDKRGSAIAAKPCRKAARAWSRWKAQERYRDTATGKQQRNGQSRRYRERVRSRKSPADERQAALAVATLLLARVPACDGARLGTRAALAKDTRRLRGIGARCGVQAVGMAPPVNLRPPEARA